MVVNNECKGVDSQQQMLYQFYANIFKTKWIKKAVVRIVTASDGKNMKLLIMRC